MSWVMVGEDAKLPIGTGIAAWVDCNPVAIFDLGKDGIYAIDNTDPATGVSLLSRGLVCEIKGQLCVASPLYKQHYRFDTGICVEDESLVVAVYDVKKENGNVYVRAKSDQQAA